MYRGKAGFISAAWFRRVDFLQRIQIVRHIAAQENLPMTSAATPDSFDHRRIQCLNIGNRRCCILDFGATQQRRFREGVLSVQVSGFRIGSSVRHYPKPDTRHLKPAYSSRATRPSACVAARRTFRPRRCHRDRHGSSELAEYRVRSEPGRRVEGDFARNRSASGI
jgi:hypothetical protein